MSSSSSTSDPDQDLRSWLDANQLEWPEYRQLFQLLSNSIDPALSNDRAWIVDVNAQAESITRCDSFSTASSFRTGLNLTDPTTSTQLILFKYTNLQTLDTRFVREVMLRCHIDPLFFFNQFSQAIDRSQGLRDQPIFSQLPSLRHSIQLGFQPFLHASIIINEFSQKTLNTARPIDIGMKYLHTALPTINMLTPETVFIMICEEHAPSASTLALETGPTRHQKNPNHNRRLSKLPTISDRFIELLLRLPPARLTKNSALAGSLIQPLYQLFALEFQHSLSENVQRTNKKLSITRHARSYQSSVRQGSAESFQYQADFNRRVQNRDREALEKTLHSLLQDSHFSDRWLTNALTLREWQLAIADMKHIADAQEKAIEDLDGNVSRYIAHQSLEISTQAYEQSSGLRFVTILAFLFLPMSLTTSIFGMNIEILGTGSTPTWTVISTAALVILATTVCFILALPITALTQATSRGLHTVRQSSKIIRRFTVISPVGGLCLVVAGFFYGEDMLAKVLFDTGIFEVLQLGRDWQEPGWVSSMPEAKQNGVTYPPFLAMCVDQIVETTKHRGWQRYSLYAKWRMGQRAFRSEERSE